MSYFLVTELPGPKWDPYFFPDLADTTAADEQAAIDAGVVEATRIDWAGFTREIR